jgi:hypothetical protein
MTENSSLEHKKQGGQNTYNYVCVKIVNKADNELCEIHTVKLIGAIHRRG